MRPSRSHKFNEIVRFDGPAQGTSRVAICTTQLHGVTIEPGQVVMTALAAANRDPAEFANPHALVLDRAPNRHLGFGWGATPVWVRRSARSRFGRSPAACWRAPRPLRLAGTPVQRRTAATVRSMEVLPVAFGDD
jgi:hypothetical protein